MRFETEMKPKLTCSEGGAIVSPYDLDEIRVHHGASESHDACHVSMERTMTVV